MPKSKLRGGAKAHRAKVAKRNKLISQEKSGMQKVFDKLMEEQIQKLKNNEWTCSTHQNYLITI